MSIVKKILYVAAFALFLTLGAVQAQDSLQLDRPETDSGRDGAADQSVGGQSSATESKGDAIKMARPETDADRASAIDQPSLGSTSGGSVEASRPATDGSSYSEE